MTAVEVLEFLSNKTDAFLFKIFAEEDVDGILEAYSPQEIVDRIEKYEAEQLVNNSDKFKVGDWVTPKGLNLSRKITKIKDSEHVIVIADDGNNYCWNIKGIGHAEPPKEEKQKIENIKPSSNYIVMVNRINELVDAVNELRGAE